MIQWYLDRRAKKSDRADAKKEEEEESDAIETKELKATIDRLIIADRTIMYDRIKHIGKTYIKREWVTIEELEDLMKMHSVYHNELGGNGFLDDLMEKVKALQRRAS